jgi:FKBP-type peptidyl-prolyl cis-trans isomerase FklB
MNIVYHNGTTLSPCSECHYRGTLIDGTEFDSSYTRGKPTTFAPNQVIKGWTEAMQLMKEGDKFELYIPSELAYGDRQRGQFITPVSYTTPPS